MNLSSNAFEIDLIEAAKTSSIDSQHNSSLDHRTTFVSNDYAQGKKVVATLEMELGRCTSFAFSVAFITMSGITPLLQTFKELEDKGICGKILTTDYLSFSDPRALKKLNEFSNIELRMYRTTNENHGFHTKGYLFERSDGSFRALIGSSNLTGSAISVNKEWNTRVAAMPDGELMKDILDEFSRFWHKGCPLDAFIETYEALYKEKQLMIRANDVVSMDQVRLEPNCMQTQFVKNLTEIISSGKTRALLISATGTGKTYASAFAMRHEQPGRVLFLAHREQVLKQSIKTYKRVFGKTKTFGLLSGNSSDKDTDYLFATMQTMSKEQVLSSFDPTTFSTVIIDEVHRAGSQSYLTILDYFKADFFLGMTASPDRPDGFDIYGLFDNNIAYEIRLQQALEEDLLCPFHYFGITDLQIDGSEIDDETGLKNFQYLVSEARVSYIIEKAEYYGYSGDRVRGLIFCSRKDEARELSTKFNEKGFRTTFLSGEDSQEVREMAVSRLSSNSPSSEEALDYIFTVDIFNEGVDIPNVNQVIMLRPTESPIIFVQQLGRGLRKSLDKDYVVVLDFIGNYTNNYMIPLALSGDRSGSKDAIRKYVMEGIRVIPGASSIHFDEISRERIFRSIDQSRTSLKMLKSSYQILKHKLGRIPDMVDFQDHSEIDPMLFVESQGSYHAFLKKADDEYEIQFSQDKELVLEYVSKFIANGMRSHELLILKDLLFVGLASKASLKTGLYEYCAVSLTDDDYSSAKRIMNKSFINSRSDKKKYDSIELVSISENSNDLISSHQFQSMLEDDSFKLVLLDIIQFGLQRNKEKYDNKEGNLTLYEKYTRKDVCRLLNWSQDDSSTIYGYRVKYNTCPIFVTYNKEDDISSSTQYEDAFIDQRTFSWMTRSRLTLESDEVKRIINADELNIDIHLFIKQSNDEGSDFYYMGKAHSFNPTQTTILDDNGKRLPIVNIQLRLETPVREDLYEYFVNNLSRNEAEIGEG